MQILEQVKQYLQQRKVKFSEQGDALYLNEGDYENISDLNKQPWFLQTTHTGILKATSEIKDEAIWKIEVKK